MLDVHTSVVRAEGGDSSVPSCVLGVLPVPPVSQCPQNKGSFADFLHECTAGSTSTTYRCIFLKDAYFLTWNPKISGKQPFSAFPKNFPYFLSFQEKRRHFGGGTKSIIPGWSMHCIKHEYTILSGLWAVIFSHFHSTQ